MYALLINFILLGDNSNEHYSMEKEITLSKTKKFFFNKDHRTVEKHRLLQGRAGSGTFHYKKGDSVTSLLLLPSFFLILTHLGPSDNISWGFSHCVIFTRRSLSLSLLHCFCLEPGLGIRSLVFRAINLFFVSEQAIRS